MSADQLVEVLNTSTKSYIVLYFFKSHFGCVFFVLGPVEDLGGAVGPEIDCVTYCVVVATTGACCNIRLCIRHR